MENGLFEGYIGIHSDNGQYIHDVIMIMMFVLLSLFAIVFRTHFPLLQKMLTAFLSIKERQNMFDSSMKKNIFFKGFMKFQTLFLCSIFCYLIYCDYTKIQVLNLRSAFLIMGFIFVIIYIFQLFKIFLYTLYGQVFCENGKFRLWNSNYHTLTYIWGVLLYFPTLWLLFDSQHIMYILSLFLLIYILYRIAFIYTTIRIFYNKNTSFLFLISYLCGQEIIPLLFLYEGLNYLHNIIDTSTLWH